MMAGATAAPARGAVADQVPKPAKKASATAVPARSGRRSEVVGV